MAIRSPQAPAWAAWEFTRTGSPRSGCPTDSDTCKQGPVVSTQSIIVRVSRWECSGSGVILIHFNQYWQLAKPSQDGSNAVRRPLGQVCTYPCHPELHLHRPPEQCPCEPHMTAVGYVQRSGAVWQCEPAYPSRHVQCPYESTTRSHGWMPLLFFGQGPVVVPCTDRRLTHIQGCPDRGYLSGRGAMLTSTQLP